jgi:hypothetical protein
MSNLSFLELKIARHMCSDSSLGVSHLPIGHDGFCHFKFHHSAFQNFSLGDRWETRMCFKRDTSGPDIWLTIESGRYVPAPPMVFVPGLRPLQERLYHKEHRTGSHLTSDNNVARLPSNAIKPAFSPPLPIPMPLPEPWATDHTPTSLTQPPTQTLTPEPASSELTAEVADVAAAILENESAAAAAVAPEVLCPEPTEKPMIAPVKGPREDEVKELTSTRRNTKSDEESDSWVLPSQQSPAPPESTAPSPSRTAASDSSNSCSSSLHSILKKTSTSTLEKTKSETEAGSGGKAHSKDEKRARKPKIQKSVSFAQDMAAPIPAPAPPPKTKEARPISAADEGSAIAKKLVEWMASSQRGGYPIKDFQGARENVDLRRSSHHYKSKDNAANRAAGIGKREKVTKKFNTTTGAPSRVVRTDGAGSEQVGKARMTQRMIPNYEFGSYVDDEIPSRWP